MVQWQEGITPKSCVALISIVVPRKTLFFFGRGWGSGVRGGDRKDMNQQKHTKNGVQHRIFCHFGLFLPFYPTNNHKNKNFKKNEENP